MQYLLLIWTNRISGEMVRVHASSALDLGSSQGLETWYLMLFG
jgi:hypothetical protein